MSSPSKVTQFDAGQPLSNPRLWFRCPTELSGFWLPRSFHSVDVLAWCRSLLVFPPEGDNSSLVHGWISDGWTLAGSSSSL